MNILFIYKLKKEIVSRLVARCHATEIDNFILLSATP